MHLARSASLFLSALILSAALSAPASARDDRVYFSFAGENRLPECTAASVQSAVAGSVARARKDYYGGRTILGIDQVQEVGYQINGISPVARRYCRGKASLSDGSYQSVHYLVEEHAGFVGVSWNVEACLAPLDKWRVYGAHCSTTRPH
ncbi:cytoplasmic protein [Roseibium salinum]|uniref:Cytoplasmic protein n=1 Tax=Roseibium salinum TaxID=1604349 RepID=A0ABT3QXL5_9HYPH|nr:cytoplasmic protein [Roseibium sp. DSM 29163]MCX2721664.1 cytoplasmic protein [Roseibium sp. DSM 29163]